MPRSPTLERAYRPVAALLGSVLLVAAALKLVDTGPAVPSPVTAALSGWAVGLVPVVEAALGVWLVSGVWRYGAWLAALPVLVVFSAYGLALTVENRTSCGCFGRVEVPPWLMLGFDVVILGMLVRCRPGWRGWPADTPGLRAGLQAAAVAVAVVGGAVGWAYARYGSVAVAVAAARGLPVAVTPGTLDAGTIEADGKAERVLRVVNLSAEPVQVVMAISNCGRCVDVAGLPVTLPPGGGADLPVTVTAGQAGGRFQRVGWLRTSAGDIDFGITAWVAGGPAGPAAGYREGGR
jgi:hypothetical protein